MRIPTKILRMKSGILRTSFIPQAYERCIYTPEELFEVKRNHLEYKLSGKNEEQIKEIVNNHEDKLFDYEEDVMLMDYFAKYVYIPGFAPAASRNSPREIRWDLSETRRDGEDLVFSCLHDVKPFAFGVSKVDMNLEISM